MHRIQNVPRAKSPLFKRTFFNFIHPKKWQANIIRISTREQKPYQEHFRIIFQTKMKEFSSHINYHSSGCQNAYNKTDVIASNSKTSAIYSTSTLN
jgi:hypothetical protein